MKRVLSVVWMLLFLVGCGRADDAMDRAMLLRSKLLQGEGCAFLAEITADYAKTQCSFKMRCKCDSGGNITFEVVAPETISGITGSLSADGGHLTFDEHALLFSMLAEGRLSPVSGPWVLLRALRSGYITGCGEKDGGLTIHIDDSYEQDALQVILQTNGEMMPVSAEIYYSGNRILKLIVEDFLIL